MVIDMKVLVVDDEKLIREVIKEYCNYEGFLCEEASDGTEAIELVKNNDYDVMVLDIMMPKLDGFRTCKEIKNIKDIPTIMLSARTDEYDKLHGFDLGIDDYLTKPFSPKELIARIKVVANRRGNTNVSKYKFGTLEIDDLAHTVLVDNKKIDLTPKEYDLLLYLVQNENIALSREQLLSKVWGYDFFGDDRTIDTHIKTLRNSLKENRKYIVTVRGMGYKFENEKES